VLRGGFVQHAVLVILTKNPNIPTHFTSLPDVHPITMDVYARFFGELRVFVCDPHTRLRAILNFDFLINHHSTLLSTIG